MTGLGSSCGACKFLRRRCTSDCIFAPYFSYEQAASHFSAVHKVFGASNVSKLLLHLPAQNRSDAAITVSYEALARMRDPIYGCVAHIFALQQQVINLQEEIEVLENHLTSHMIGVTGCGSSQAHNNPCSQPNFSSHHHHMNILDYQNQPAAVIDQVENINTTHGFDNQMNVPISTCEHQNFVSESSSFCLDKLVQGVDHEIFAYDPWLEISNNIVN